MKSLNLFGFAMFSVVLSVSAHAACGGGGYSPNKNKNSSNTTYSSGSTSTTQTASSNSYSSSTPVSKYNNSSSFDVSAFHNISGQLHLSGEQATGVINAITEIRRKLDENATPPKDFDPKKEFEKKLATILNPEQLKTYQTAVKPS